MKSYSPCWRIKYNMYFPLLRGKQFELIALRELSDMLSEDSDLISPIIEPVKKSSATFRKTLIELKDNNINFNIIMNPIVGEFLDENDDLLSTIAETLNDYNNFQVSFYISRPESVNDCIQITNRIRFGFNGFSLIHISQVNNLEIFNELENHHHIFYNIINFGKTSRRYHRNFSQETRISLDDYFRILSKNSDYLREPDEPFSEEHLYYNEDGFIGFSDYLTIGEPYSETGFLPYAVVIHLTYTDNDNKIRIRHFVSDSNEDNNDVAGKFSEALDKLMEWTKSNEVLDTQALNEFRLLHENGHFPGLGVIKKLSIKHHIELVTNLLSI